MVGDSTRINDLTSKFVGRHPFAVQVVYGDDQVRAYVGQDPRAVTAPGVQAITPATSGTLAATHGINAPDLHRVARELRTDLPFLLNCACQFNPQNFVQRMRKLAAAAGTTIGPGEQHTLDALRQSVESAQALGPQAITRAAVAYLAASGPSGDCPYATLVDHVNRVLTNPGRNPRAGQPSAPIGGVDDIAPGGLRLWWVKEGSATIVFQVRVELGQGRPPAHFALNVAKDATSSADDLRQAHADFVDFYQIDPCAVMEPYGMQDVTVATWRGPVVIPVFAAEWFEGHELHVYEGGSRLHVWKDQRMGMEHPLPAEVSDRIWEQTIRMRARFTRRSAHGLLPIATYVNAGDYIFRETSAGESVVLLIWARRPPASVRPGDFVVLSSMFTGANVFGADEGRTVWWDEPARALGAMCAGLGQAGFGATEIDEILRQSLAGPLTQFAGDPQLLPHSRLIRTADPDELRRVFRRARETIENELLKRR
jgi:hypothetical protein